MILSVCWVWDHLNRHCECDNDLCKHNLCQDIQHPHKTDILQCGMEVRSKNQIMIMDHFLSEPLQIALSTSQEPVAQCRATISREANCWCLSTTPTASEQREDIVEYCGKSRPPPPRTHFRWLLPLLQMLKQLLVQTVIFISLTWGN